MTRENRKGYELPVRVSLLEEDMDQHEVVLQRHMARIEKIADEVKDELKGYSKVLIGILVSVSTASVLLAANLLVTGGA